MKAPNQEGKVILYYRILVSRVKDEVSSSWQRFLFTSNENIVPYTGTWEAVPSHLNSTSTVIGIKGTLEIKCSMQDDVRKLVFRNPIFRFKWHDELDARSFKERSNAEPDNTWPNIPQMIEGAWDKVESLTGAPFWFDVYFDDARKFERSQNYDYVPIRP